jgi:ABC-type oligopeptide transport system substrate-binding subunit
LTLLCGEGEETRLLAQYILQSWQKNLAVYFTIEQVSEAELIARLTAGNYHLALAPATAAGDSPADALRLFAGEGGQNWARYRNTKWEKQLNSAGDLAALQAAEEALAAACPAVPLAAVPRVFAVAEDVSGVDVIPFTDRLDFTNARR